MKKFDTYNEWLTHQLLSPENTKRFIGEENDKPYTIDGPLHVAERVGSWGFEEAEIVNLSHGEYKTIHISLEGYEDWVTGLLRADIPMEKLPTLFENSKYSHEISVDGASVGFRPQSEVERFIEAYKDADFDDEYFDEKGIKNKSWVTMDMGSDGLGYVFILEKDGENVGLIMDCDSLKLGQSYIYDTIQESGLSEYTEAHLVKDDIYVIVGYGMPGEDNYLALTTNKDNAFRLVNAIYDNRDKIQSTDDKKSAVHEIVETLPYKTSVISGDLGSLYDYMTDVESGNIKNDMENNITLTDEDLEKLQGPSLLF